jgi:hypothetical protein
MHYHAKLDFPTFSNTQQFTAGLKSRSQLKKRNRQRAASNRRA